ncbi:hypothetical protein RCH13_001313 [Chryseobacterium sp. MP_3.2]|nr:hypothetical protein [Chryseobacterium sp. MP_3.2]
MIKIHLLACCLLATMLHAQTVNYAKAPNSYIYDLNLAQEQNYGGLEIPVKKAYEMWSTYEYLKTNGSATPIPSGVQSASLYWEDLPGLVDKVEIISGGSPDNSNIKVAINKGLGKGNAVVAFKVDGNIYWSWHIWVTDNPEDGVSYAQGTETDIDGNLIDVKYMDRNLGATSNNFLGNQWQKSGGLLYEWGRKDPFPSLVHKDSFFYSITGEVGNLKHPQVDPVNTIPVQVRPFNEIEKNIKYSVANPITYITNTDSGGNWFSSSRYRIPGASPAYFTWDLWSDNAKGGNSNGNSSSTVLKNESRSYELKSELDPCPNGWRIPSYYGRETQNNNLSIFGKKWDWGNDDNIVANRQLFPTSINPNLNGVKVYPGLGMDFTEALGGGRNLGIIPASGAYVAYPNSAAPTAPVGVKFQDNFASATLWSATFGFDGGRAFNMVTDPLRNNTSVGLHAVYNNQTQPTRTGNAVRCMKDPNLWKIGNFTTNYYATTETNFTDGLDNPNSYIVLENREITIPVNKAFSVYNQLLTDHKTISGKEMKAKIMWTTDVQLIDELWVNQHESVASSSTITVKVNPGRYGNAVISLHQGNVDNPVLWSWHIWVPQDDPTLNQTTYITENTLPVTYNFINPTASKVPALKTVFMDRNLGAESAVLNSGYEHGLYYQWGRKDPIPSFSLPHYELIYTETELTVIFNPTELGKTDFNFDSIDPKIYQYTYSDSYQEYGSTDPSPHKRVRDNIKYSVNNPMRFMYQSGLGNSFDGGNHYSNDLSQVRDWVSDERAQADNRWGHGDKKSPFDPCPEGWRVPDVSFTHLYTGSKGTSPFYNGYQNDAYGNPGVIQDQWHSISTFYNGTVEGNLGWKFESPNYNLGTFAKDGIIGELGEFKREFGRTGLWTASLADLNTGFGLGLLFEGNRMQTATGVYPQAGMGVRCAKDENRLLATPMGKNPKKIEIEEKLVSQAVEKNAQGIYPNPFNNEFFIQNANAESFELYEMSGKLLMKGRITNGRVDAANLLPGIYLVKITMKDGSVFTKKLLKQ